MSKKFDYETLNDLVLTFEMNNQLTAIHEYKGKQELYIENNLQILDKLVDLAIIQSTNASNAIEGISTSDKRLREIVESKAEPHNRNEKEIAGYRDVLKTIHESYQYIQIKPNDILTLHKQLYTYSGDRHRGNYKSVANVIEETSVTGEKFVRFVPASVIETPILMEELCNDYNRSISEGIIDPLIIINSFILDFLSIHPFSDGNGRMSRLLMLLMLYKEGYLVGKYVSIEMIIEKTKETYYETLKESSQNWHENKNSYAPFVSYMLGVILRAYTEFNERYVLVHNQKVSSKQRVLSVINKSFIPLGKSDIVALIPEYSKITIERALTTLYKEAKIGRTGVGRSTKYISIDRV